MSVGPGDATRQPVRRVREDETELTHEASPLCSRDQDADEYGSSLLHKRPCDRFRIVGHIELGQV